LPNFRRLARVDRWAEAFDAKEHFGNFCSPEGAGDMFILVQTGVIMMMRHAMGRLFPPSLFLFMGVEFLRDWHFDPMLLGIAICMAAGSLAWLIVSTMHVAKEWHVETQKPQALRAASASGTAG
jgi:H+/Cl- antiporter ClcA